MSAERSARNEARFRDANEQIDQRRAEILGDGDDRATPFICECDDERCTEVVLLKPDEYRDVRRSPRRFLIHPGHDSADGEVVSRRETHWLVEKQGVAGRVAEEEAAS